jgi:hypothetical protein
MPRKYNIGDKRDVIVKKVDGHLVITIEEEGADKKIATFTSQRWAQFLQLVDHIDMQIALMQANQYVCFKSHIGGKLYVSITSGYPCVDIRQHFYRKGHGVQPTKTGIAIRLHEWVNLKTIMPEMYKKYPSLQTTQPCSQQPDHQNMEVYVQCRECSPFHFEEMWDSMTPRPSCTT